MLKQLIYTFISIFIFSNLWSQDTTIKPIPNVPISYHLIIDGELLHKKREESNKIGNLNIEQDFILEIVQKDKKVPEILITPLRTLYKHEGFGFTLSFDSKSIPKGKLPALESWNSVWGKPFHIPLTNDEKYIQEHSDIHDYLDPEQRARYQEFVKNVLDYINNGERYTDGQILWHYDESSEREKIQGGAKVAKITGSEVILEALVAGLFHQAIGESSTAQLTAKGESKIQKTNSLLRDGNGTLNIRIFSNNAQPATYLGEGELLVNATMKLTSRKKLE